MKVFGIAGYSGAGKTTLLEKLIPRLISRGLKVSVIKHAHHGFDIDRPGKDSYRHREAGAAEVLLACGERWALMHELREQVHPPLEYLLSRLQSCDLVLIEGFKTGDFPKLEVWRPALFKAPLGPGWPGIVATASDEPQRVPHGPALDLHDIPAIAQLVMDRAQPCSLGPAGRAERSADWP